MNLDNLFGDVAEGGTPEMYASMPLNQYIRIWLDTFKKGSVKQATFTRLNESAKVLKDYPIAQKPIGEITSFDVQRYVHQLTERGYGLTTIKKQMRIVTAPLKQAAAMHFIQADPSVCIQLPKQESVKKPTREVRAYTEDEQNRLWAEIAISSRPGAKAIGLMLETGLRVGEALALRWKYIDIARKRLTVAATILNIADKKRSVLQESPKTVSSKRIVPLTPKAVEILNYLKEHSTSEWVFENGPGERLTYEALRYQTVQICKNANVEYLGQHVFRHTFATNCYYKHVDVKVLSKILGHSDVNITYNIYITLRGDGFDEMYEALNGAC